MTPTIIVDKETGDPKLVVGGAGGSKITTGILQGEFFIDSYLIFTEILIYFKL